MRALGGLRGFVVVLAMAGCVKDATKHGGGSGDGGSGGSGDGGNVIGSDGATVFTGSIGIVIRDFKLYSASDSTTNPDFENVPTSPPTNNGEWDDEEIVTDPLGSDHKPVYKNTTGTTLTTHGMAGFDQWYNDTPGVNIHVDYPLTLTANGDGTFGYDCSVSGTPLSAQDMTRQFFPIDDGTQYATMFGDQGDPHNYSFTAESHNTFVYTGGETFHYRGDDDVFVYINNKLVINMGGIHGPETMDVALDSLGLTKGGNYPLDFFFAERHKTGSNLLFTSSFMLTTVSIN